MSRIGSTAAVMPTLADRLAPLSQASSVNVSMPPDQPVKSGLARYPSPSHNVSSPPATAIDDSSRAAADDEANGEIPILTIGNLQDGATGTHPGRAEAPARTH